jgi:glycosyltransferase involved in cell wall biosynthesis
VLGLVTSGQLYKRGADVLIAAAAAARPFRDRSAVLLIVAQGAEAAWVQRLAASHGLADRTLVAAPRSDVATFYAALDAAALPARYEEFGIAALEAMAAGVPTLLTRTVGASEVVPGLASADLLAPGDVPALTAAIERCLADPAWASAWATRCQGAAVAHTATRSGQQWAAALGPLLG